MTHLLISREYPPSTYARGGIGTYVEQIARLLAQRGETVHVIAEQWDRAPRPIDRQADGRLVVHRVPLGRPLAIDEAAGDAPLLEQMAASAFPAQAFSWQAARLAESLIEAEPIDVIEAQDYEAPLYYFLLRRAAGAGPARRPPCVVHLHTPWEFVCAANGWACTTDYDLALKACEEFSIVAADALMCPSRFLSDQAASRYGLDRARIEVLPYPIGDTPRIERTREVWATGVIAFVGRLEGRKGVIEWTRAAARVAAEMPDARFELVGADTSPDGDGASSSSMRARLQDEIPAAVRDRFTFVDALSRPLLWKRLEQARIAVVPSRWENFPLTCVEAMASGLPVLASPHGGMVEMIEDGQTGWIAASGQPEDLADALRRALGTTAERRAEMGRDAASAIRRLCDDKSILDRHLTFKQRVAAAGAARSTSSSRLPDWVTSSAASIDARIAAHLADAAERLGGVRPLGRGALSPAIVAQLPVDDQARLAWRAIRNPRYALSWLAWHGRRLWRARDRR